jgi:hypothetical protein
MKQFIGRTLTAAVAAIALSGVNPAAAQEPQKVTVTPTMDERAANFDKSDLDKDGSLTREEFATTPRALPPADGVKAFTASDLNKDGKVSKAEFLDPNFGTALSKLSEPAKP